MIKHLKLIFAGTMLAIAFSVPVYADCIPGDTQSPPCTAAQPAPGSESNVPPSASSTSTESVVTELAIELIEETLLYF
jgi:hypothetical protein